MARINKLPFPFEFALASAAMHDLEIAKDTLPSSEYENIDLYADLAYKDQQFQLDLFEEKAINLFFNIFLHTDYYIFRKRKTKLRKNFLAFIFE